MSYDISIGSENFNYTFNVAPMWYACYPDKGIREFYELTGKESLPVLQELRNYMEDNYEHLITMNPANNWGDYHGALNFVNTLIQAALRNPDEIWEGD